MTVETAIEQVARIIVDQHLRDPWRYAVEVNPHDVSAIVELAGPEDDTETAAAGTAMTGRWVAANRIEERLAAAVAEEYGERVGGVMVW